ncbi:AAA-domain-containing protein [Crepidotus variabilis]|uniref:AAA-domain-containing protein n=1 Tax=Crepidotus variabilis TaxID=179855 RepID=A0A9P6E7V3_9AGAR|nr:AAA-domain-containing protein [Crepidotus variabilis]
MSSIASRLFFTVGINESADVVPRVARRVCLNSELLKSAKITTGDLVALFAKDGASHGKEFAVGVAWPSIDVQSEHVLVSSSLLLTAALVVNQTVRIIPLSDRVTWKSLPYLPTLRPCVEAGSILLKEILSEGGNTGGRTKPPTLVRGGEWLHLALRELLVDLKYIVNFQIIVLSYQNRQRQFRVQKITTGTNSAPIEQKLLADLDNLSIDKTVGLWQVTWDCNVTLDDSSVPEDNANSQIPTVEELPQSQPQDAYSGVGGLDKQIEIIRDLLEIPLTKPELFRHLGLKAPRGILLHGPPGTGKTHLARAIASSTGSSVLVVNGPELSSAYHGETESKLRNVFKQAREKSPCIVVLDEVDALVPKREEGGGEVEKRVVATLLTILDGMGQEHNEGIDRVVIIGTTNRPNAIDPALRRPGRFDREIEIGIPDAEARFAILSVLLRKTPNNIQKTQLHSLASRMYGYVGADIEAVVREAGTLAIKKWAQGAQPYSSSSTKTLLLQLQDLVDAMPGVRPSAMRSLFFETPPIRYSDIGGQAPVIQKLKEAVEWPLLHPEAFQRLGVKPPKGILLFGPPGCSKTILARACACESGINFVAVKGPEFLEVLNKFVGESERAVREIFRKARAASPSIIFFDEIDALGTSRTASDSDRGSSHEGVLTSLLNEMDGVQELNGVTVIAATNRPEAIDSALMRPGRLDRILWVGPPDCQGREEILKIRTLGMSVGPDVDISAIAQITEGCSGAEITSLCQEAAILTMQEDIHAPHVPQRAFISAAGKIKKQITPAVLQHFDKWRSGCDVRQL